MSREFLVDDRVRVISGVTGTIISIHGNEYIVELDATGYPLLCHPEELQPLEVGTSPLSNRRNQNKQVSAHKDD